MTCYKAVLTTLQTKLACVYNVVCKYSYSHFAGSVTKQVLTVRMSYIAVIELALLHTNFLYIPQNMAGEGINDILCAVKSVARGICLSDTVYKLSRFERCIFSPTF